MSDDSGDPTAASEERRSLGESIDVWYMNPDHDWEACLRQGVIVAGWDAVQHLDLREAPDSEVRKLLEDAGHPDTPDTLFRFRDDLPTGAVLIAKDGRSDIHGLGVVKGEYQRRELQGISEESVHVREVDWLIDLHAVSDGRFEVNWADSEYKTFQPSTGVHEINSGRYQEIRDQILDQHGNLAENFERLELVSRGITARYDEETELDYFWVNQGNESEIEGQYLQAPYPPESWQQQLSRVSVGDVVIHRRSSTDEVFAESTVLTEAQVSDEHQRVPVYLDEFDTPMPVEPIYSYLSRQRFYDKTDYYLFNKHHERMTGYLFNLPAEAGRRILDWAEHGISSEIELTDEQREEVASELSLPTKTIDTWIQALNRKRQAIFFGPPGTGKTHAARTLANIITDGPVGISETVQFHQSYEYEDFIQGIRPILDDSKEEHDEDRDGLQYQRQSGTFYRFCERAREYPGPCILILDEINRADVSSVFGELMYLLEYRDESVTLAQDDEEFAIPDNVYLLGTMNTADRSIALVDFALRRRFAFIKLGPEFDVLREELDLEGIDVEGLIKQLETINDEIGDENYELGFTYFLDVDSVEEMRNVWEFEIEPYLEEFFIEEPGTVDSYRWSEVRDNIVSSADSTAQ